MVFRLIVEADPKGKSQSGETAQRRTRTRTKWPCSCFRNGQYRAAPGSVAARRVGSQAPPSPRRRRLRSTTLEQARSGRTVEWIMPSGPVSTRPQRPNCERRTVTVCWTRSTKSECALHRPMASADQLRREHFAPPQMTSPHQRNGSALNSERRPLPAGHCELGPPSPFASGIVIRRTARAVCYAWTRLKGRGIHDPNRMARLGRAGRVCREQRE